MHRPADSAAPSRHPLGVNTDRQGLRSVPEDAAGYMSGRSAPGGTAIASRLSVPTSPLGRPSLTDGSNRSPENHRSPRSTVPSILWASSSSSSSSSASSSSASPSSSVSRPSARTRRSPTRTPSPTTSSASPPTPRRGRSSRRPSAAATAPSPTSRSRSSATRSRASGIAGVYANLNADAATTGASSGYKLSAPGAATLTITGCNFNQKNKVVATVTGTGPGQIATVVSNLAAAATTC